MCAVRNVCGLVGCGGRKTTRSTAPQRHRISITEQQAGQGKGKAKTTKWQENATDFDNHTCRLLFSSSLLPRVLVQWLCVREERD